MAIEVLEKEIDGVRYTSTRIPAMRATKLQNRLGRVLGPAVVKVAGAIVSALGEGGAVEQAEVDRIDFGEIGAAVAEVFTNLDDATTEGLIRDILGATAYLDEKGDPRPLFPGGGSKAFDDHFTGSLPRMWKVIGFALGVNYGGFFDVVSDLIARGRSLMGRKAAETSASQTSGSPA